MAKGKSFTNYMSQRQKFIKAAKKSGASEDADVFRRAVRSVATAPPMPKPKKGAGKRN